MIEMYLLDKKDLKILAFFQPVSYEINLDEETNAKSIFVVNYNKDIKKGNFLVLNGLYKQFLFIIEDVSKEKENTAITITVSDISNIFNRKVIEQHTEIMTNAGLEDFIANIIGEEFVLSEDDFLNVAYIDVYVHTHTSKKENTNAEDFLYNFHTFITNCRQNSGINVDFSFTGKKLRIDIAKKEKEQTFIDTTVPEVTDYTKIYETDITAKVMCYCRDTNYTYNLYLKTDRTTTTNKNDPDRASGNIEVISIDKQEDAYQECLNVMKGNSYKHLVEFKIAKTSKLVDVTKLEIGSLVKIRTEDGVYDSYISAITLTDENFVYFKSGNIRISALDKIKKNTAKNSNKLDINGGNIIGNLSVKGSNVVTVSNNLADLGNKKERPGNCVFYVKIAEIEHDTSASGAGAFVAIITGLSDISKLPNAVILECTPRLQSLLYTSLFGNNQNLDCKFGVKYKSNTKEIWMKATTNYMSRVSMQVLDDWNVVSTDFSTAVITEPEGIEWYSANSTVPDSSGGLACFTGDTLILTENGLKKIKEIDLGDRIVTKNGISKVHKIYKHITKKIYEITVNNQIIRASFSHPFATERGVILASELVKGDLVKNINGVNFEIEEIKTVDQETEVFEINTFEDNYYITNSKILVLSEVLE